MIKPAILTTLLLCAASAQVVPATPLGGDSVREVKLSDLARRQLPVTVSPNYQVQLTLPASVDAVIGNKPGLVRVTVLPAPLDRFVFLDALQPQGSGDLTIFVGGQPIKFKLSVDGKGQDGIREYAVRDETIATQASGPVAPQDTAPATKGPDKPATAAEGSLQTATAPSEQPLNTSQTVAPASSQPAARPHPIQANVGGAPVEASFDVGRDGDSLIVDYTLKSLADKALIVHQEDLRVMGGSASLPVDHVRPAALSVLLPGRTVTGRFRVQTPSNDVQLVWPMSNLASRASYAVQVGLSATK